MDAVSVSALRRQRIEAATSDSGEARMESEQETKKNRSKGSVMLNPAVSRPSRPWREIAAEVTQEKDSRKLAKLVEELNRAMSEQCVRPTSTRERTEAS